MFLSEDMLIPFLLLNLLFALIVLGTFTDGMTKESRLNKA